MKKTKLTDQFLTDLDAVLEKTTPETSQDAPSDYEQALQVARRLAQLDPSQHSQQRIATRTRLLERAADELPRRTAQIKWRSRLTTSLRWGFGIAALLLLALALSWILSTIRPSPATQGMETQNSTNTFPTPTPYLLKMDTPIEEIISRMSSAWWNSVWVDGSDTRYSSEGQAETTYTQAWLARTGQGRVIMSESIPGLPLSPLEVRPRWLWISDGLTLAAYDLFSGLYDPANSQFGWANHPLENAGPFMQVIFPYYLTGRGGVFQPVNEESYAGREALVIEWRPDASRPIQERFWVDQLTGFILRRLRMLEDGTPVEDLQVRAIVYDRALPDNLSGAGGLDSIRFTANPEEVSIPDTYVPLPTPMWLVETPLPTVAVDSTLVRIVPVPENFQDDHPDPGDLYLSQRVFGVEQDQLLRIDTACLFDAVARSSGCVGYQSFYPTLAWTPLYWSPDGSRAAFLDSNNARLLSFNPQTGEWLTLSEQFFATAQVLAWSPDSSWIAITLQGDASKNESLLTLVRADGTGQITPAPDLGGMQLPIGWLDNEQILFMQYTDVPKGQVGQATDPVLYLYNLRTGSWNSTTLGFSRSAVAQPPVLSPDRTRLAIPLGDADGYFTVVGLTNQESTHVEIPGMNPVWSPDGQWLAAVRLENGVYHLVVVRPDGSEERKVFEWTAFPVATWAADSQHLVIEAAPVGDQPGSQLFLVSMTDRTILQIVLDGLSSSYELRYPSFRFVKDLETGTFPPATALNPFLAQSIALTPADLGEGWLLENEKTDLNDSYYFDRGEDGQAILGTHKTVHTPMFDPALVESITLRAFSQPERKLVLWHMVVVFKDNAQAEETAKAFLVKEGREGDLPRQAVEDGFPVIHQDALIGAESILSTYLNPDDNLPLIIALSFRKGHILVYMGSMGKVSDLVNIPAISEERLKELARIVEARIP